MAHKYDLSKACFVFNVCAEDAYLLPRLREQIKTHYPKATYCCIANGDISVKPFKAAARCDADLKLWVNKLAHPLHTLKTALSVNRDTYIFCDPDTYIKRPLPDRYIKTTNYCAGVYIWQNLLQNKGHIRVVPKHVYVTYTSFFYFERSCLERMYNDLVLHAAEYEEYDMWYMRYHESHLYPGEKPNRVLYCSEDKVYGMLLRQLDYYPTPLPTVYVKNKDRPITHPMFSEYDVVHSIR